MKVVDAVCLWSEVAWDDFWDTECGNKHQFTFGGPEENDYDFCPYCGGRLEVAHGE